MNDKPKKGTPSAKHAKLPRSGLAEDVLGTKSAPAAKQSPESSTPDSVAEETPAKPIGPERIFDFADSVNQEQRTSRETTLEEQIETWVTFDLAGEVFSLPVSHVQEILRIGTITAVPHAPHPVRGVTNKRGRVLPVIDLRVRLGLPEAKISSKSRILVVESRGRLLGLLVDGVQQVLRVAMSKVEPPPPDVMTEQSDYIIGVYHLDETLAILLDVDRVLVIRDNGHTDHTKTNLTA